MAIEFAQFVAVRDDPIVLPDPAVPHGWLDEGDHFDFVIQNLDLADLNTGRTALLLFKVQTWGHVRLRMAFNRRSPCIDYKFESPENTVVVVPRSWHEVVPGSDLLAQSNQLLVSVSPTRVVPPFQAGGHVVVSDIVLQYHATA